MWFGRRRKAEQELEAEIAAHLAMETERLMGQGLPAGRAAAEARRQFGNVGMVKDVTRGMWGRAWADEVRQDVHYAWRQMRRTPAMAGAVVVSLGLAIGANVAIFALIDAVVLRPLPVPEPGRLIRLEVPPILSPGDPDRSPQESFSIPLFRKFTVAAAGAARLGAFCFAGRSGVQFGGADAATERVERQFVSGDALAMLGVRPVLGRIFTADEDRRPGGAPYAVLSHEYWMRRFGGDPGVLGRTVRNGGSVYTIIGVTEAGFTGVETGRMIDIWLPLAMYSRAALDNSGWSAWRIFGRLEPGVGPEAVAARLEPPFRVDQAERAQSHATMPESIRQQFLTVPIQAKSGAGGSSAFRREFTRPLWIVQAVTAGLLLIACANAASLLLARATARAGEMAMRLSLGAGRWRLVRQLLTESAVLAAAAGALGWALAHLAAPLLVAALSTRSETVRLALALDTRVLAFAVAVSGAAAIGFGLAPAWQTSGLAPMRVLRGLGGQSARLRLGRLFVGVQVAAAFCLVLTGAAFLGTLWRLRSVDPGFDPRQVTVLTLDRPGEKGRAGESLRAPMIELRRQVAAASGVEGAAMANWAMLEGAQWVDQVIVAGRPLPEREEIFYAVTPGYWETMHAPMLAGRPLAEADLLGEDRERAAVVNLAFARRYFPGEEPVGKSFEYPNGKKTGRLRIVGVCADAHYIDMRRRGDPIVYLPFLGAGYMRMHVRSPLDPATLAALVDGKLRQLGGPWRVTEVFPFEQLVEATMTRERLLAGLGGAFALLGLLLAAVGLFGLLNYAVSRRTREIGIRAALGATRGGLMLLVGRDVAVLVAGGLAAGLAISLGTARLVETLLFEARPADPAILAVSAALFLAAAAGAAAGPARRAATVDPVIALRAE